MILFWVSKLTFVLLINTVSVINKINTCHICVNKNGTHGFCVPRAMLYQLGYEFMHNGITGTGQFVGVLYCT